MTKVHPCCWSNNFSIIIPNNVCPQRVRSIIAHARERVNMTPWVVKCACATEPFRSRTAMLTVLFRTEQNGTERIGSVYTTPRNSSGTTGTVIFG